MSGNKVVEVFKTNIEHIDATQLILQKLKEILPDSKINFDLDDCDRLLRIESRRSSINVLAVVDCIKKMNFEIEVLE